MSIPNWNIQNSKLTKNFFEHHVGIISALKMFWILEHFGFQIFGLGMFNLYSQNNPGCTGCTVYSVTSSYGVKEGLAIKGYAKSSWITWPFVTIPQVFKLPLGSYYLILTNISSGTNSACFVRLLWRLSEKICVRKVEWCLAHSKYSRKLAYIIPPHKIGTLNSAYLTVVYIDWGDTCNTQHCTAHNKHSINVSHSYCYSIKSSSNNNIK
jgi:hypothetical protein